MSELKVFLCVLAAGILLGLLPAVYIHIRTPAPDLSKEAVYWNDYSIHGQPDRSIDEAIVTPRAAVCRTIACRVRPRQDPRASGGYDH